MIIIFLFSFQLYNYFEDSNYVYLVLEICHNGELNRYLKANCRVVSETEARQMDQIIDQILREKFQLLTLALLNNGRLIG
jgi:serine/threonine protein kinase